SCSTSKYFVWSLKLKNLAPPFIPKFFCGSSVPIPTVFQHVYATLGLTFVLICHARVSGSLQFNAGSKTGFLFKTPLLSTIRIPDEPPLNEFIFIFPLLNTRSLSLLLVLKTK